MSETLIIDNLSFELRRSPKRKTIGVIVERNGDLTLSAPKDCSIEKIEDVTKKKLLWIYTKLAQKELLFQPPKKKEYLTGENHFYLGRTYRLLLYDPPTTKKTFEPLSLNHGRFMLVRSERQEAQKHFNNWYATRGKTWLEKKVSQFADRIGVAPKGVEIRDLGYRWGSCGQNGILNFHWKTITLPTKIIEYIVVHEMVHLIEPHHQSEFWRKLERSMPDFGERKNWLALNGNNFS